jgi:hypothetical protein
MIQEMIKAYERVLPKLNLRPAGRNASLSTDGDH